MKITLLGYIKKVKVNGRWRDAELSEHGNPVLLPKDAVQPRRAGVKQVPQYARG